MKAIPPKVVKLVLPIKASQAIMVPPCMNNASNMGIMAMHAAMKVGPKQNTSISPKEDTQLASKKRCANHISGALRLAGA